MDSSRPRTESVATTATVRPGPTLPYLHPPSSYTRSSSIPSSSSNSNSDSEQSTRSRASLNRRRRNSEIGAPVPGPESGETFRTSTTRTVKADWPRRVSESRKLGRKRSWSDPYASSSISISPEASSPPSPNHHLSSPSLPLSRAPTPRVSFAADSFLKPSRRVERQGSSSPEPSPSHLPSGSTWPRSALKTPSRDPPGLSISPDTTTSSMSPATPGTPGGDLHLLPSMMESTPITRQPRHHHSTGGFIASSRPFPALPFTMMSQPHPTRATSGLKKERKSSPGLLTAYQLPSNSDRDQRPRREPSPNEENRQKVTSGGWETKVTEEMLRLVRANQRPQRVRHASEPLEALKTRRASRSPGVNADAKEEFSDYRPRRQRSTREPQVQKLAAMFDNPPEPVHVHVVRQDAFDHHDPQAIDSYQIPLDIPSSELGLGPVIDDGNGLFTYRSGSGSDKSKNSKNSKSGSDRDKIVPDSNASDRLRPTRRQRKRSLRPKARATTEPRNPDQEQHDTPGARSRRTSATSPISTSLPSMRRQSEDLLSTLPSSNLRPSPSHPVLTPPSPRPETPPQRSRTASKISQSSPADSPSSGRKRLNSSVYEGSLFFTPRAGPPEDYLPEEDSALESHGPAGVSSAGSPPHTALTPGQIRLVVPDDGRREEQAAYLGKGKGKRVGPEDDDADVISNAGTNAGYAPSLASRQRKESIMTTDDDVLGELPLNPRKRIKLTSSAAYVQSLTEAVEASERQALENDLPHPELKSILTNKGTRSSIDDALPGRPDSRRSANVSFSNNDSPPESPASSRGRSRASSRLSARSPKSTIPLMAIISPRPVSASYSGGYHLREPKRYSTATNNQPSNSRSASKVPSFEHKTTPTGAEVVTMHELPWYRTLPTQGWAFFAGFVFPLFWWWAALSKVRVNEDVERAQHPLHNEDQMYTWRWRCRLMSIFSLLVYVPVITLAIIFGR